MLPPSFHSFIRSVLPSPSKSPSFHICESQKPPCLVANRCMANAVPVERCTSAVMLPPSSHSFIKSALPSPLLSPTYHFCESQKPPCFVANRCMTNDDPVEMCTSADRKSTRLNSSHHSISYAVFCL